MHTIDMHDKHTSVSILVLVRQINNTYIHNSTVIQQYTSDKYSTVGFNIPLDTL